MDTAAHAVLAVLAVYPLAQVTTSTGPPDGVAHVTVAALDGLVQSVTTSEVAT